MYFKWANHPMLIKKPYTSANSGQVGLMFGLLALPMLALAGLSFDAQRGVSAKNHARNALDYAGLAAAKMLENTDNENNTIKAVATDFFKADIAAISSDITCTDPLITINNTLGRVDLATNCEIPTTIGGLLRQDKLTVAATSSVHANITKLDVALMLDVSGSMSGAKLDALKSASKDAIDQLVTEGSGDRVRVSLVPYADAVNAGDFGETSKGNRTGNNGNGLGNGGPDGNNSGPGNGQGNAFGHNRQRGQAFEHAEQSCVSERTGSKAYKSGKPEVGAWVGDDASTCPSVGIAPISNDAEGLKSTIDQLTADGATAGHLGVAWSWYTIAPEWDDIWPTESEPREFGEPNTVKAVILMTDGGFNKNYDAGQGDSDAQARRLCNEMKADGVIVYSVAFQAPAAGEAVLRACASSDEHYFDATDAESLSAAYGSIASRLSQLRVAG